MQLRNRITLAIALALAAAGAHAVTIGPTNLLSNPGAETGTLAGWTAGGSSNPAVDDGSFDTGIPPHAGLYDFVGNNGSDGTLTQNVSLAGIAGGAMATLSFWEQGLDQGDPSDNAFVSLTFLDALGQSLAAAVTPVVDSHSGSWQQFSGTFAIPAGTASIDYTMHFARNVGSDLDAFIDDNSLTVSPVPEPATWALWLAGVGMVTAVTARRAGRADNRRHGNLVPCAPRPGLIRRG